MSKVEDYFITPLEAHFESQPTEGGRETILNDLADFNEDDLHTAAEWLKRARQSVKTFPSPKECLKAIKAVTGGRNEAGFSPSGAGVITSETYAQQALIFLGARDHAPIIKEGTAQWDEWHEYWSWLGAHWLLALVRDRKQWTVPSEFPGVFDPRFSPVRSRKAKAA